METPAKKTKLTSDEPAVDLFVAVHSDVHDLIYQHLNGKDFMNLFEVSTLWNSIAISSSAAMKKLKLCYREKANDQPTRREVMSFLQSVRPYQNIEARFQYSSKQELQLLKYFSQSIVELEVTTNNFVFTERLETTVSFPKLKFLKAKDTHSFLMIYLIRAAPILESFFVDVVSTSDEMVDLIQQKPFLKKLTVESYYFDRLPQGFSSLKPKFQLTSLVILGGPKILGFDPFVSFSEILLQMSGTLSSLELSKIYDIQDLQIVLTKFPNLQRLKLGGLGNRSFDFGALTPNETIKKFECLNAYRFLPLLKCFTGLEVLKVISVDVPCFEFIAKNMKQLKLLQIRRFKTDDRPYSWNRSKELAEAFYNNFKAEDPSIYQNIEIIVTED